MLTSHSTSATKQPALDPGEAVALIVPWPWPMRTTPRSRDSICGALLGPTRPLTPDHHHKSVPNGDTKVVSMANRAPCRNVRPSATTSKSLTSTLVATRVLSADLSGGTLKWEPPAAQNPASAHAARWWPNESRWRPHRQVRRVKGRRKCKRLHMRSRNGWASTLVTLDVGSAAKGADVKGPH